LPTQVHLPEHGKVGEGGQLPRPDLLEVGGVEEIESGMGPEGNGNRVEEKERNLEERNTFKSVELQSPSELVMVKVDDEGVLTPLKWRQSGQKSFNRS